MEHDNQLTIFDLSKCLETIHREIGARIRADELDGDFAVRHLAARRFLKPLFRGCNLENLDMMDQFQVLADLQSMPKTKCELADKLVESVKWAEERILEDGTNATQRRVADVTKNVAHVALRELGPEYASRLGDGRSRA